jgi:hypothetical protein
MASSLDKTNSILKDFSTSMSGIVSGISDVANTTLPSLVTSIGTTCVALDEMARKVFQQFNGIFACAKKNKRQAIVRSIHHAFSARHSKPGSMHAESLMSNMDGAKLAQYLEPTIERIGETLQRYMMGVSAVAVVVAKARAVVDRQMFMRDA